MYAIAAFAPPARGSRYGFVGFAQSIVTPEDLGGDLSGSIELEDHDDLRVVYAYHENEIAGMINQVFARTGNPLLVLGSLSLN